MVRFTENRYKNGDATILAKNQHILNTKSAKKQPDPRKISTVRTYYY